MTFARRRWRLSAGGAVTALLLSTILAACAGITGGTAVLGPSGPATTGTAPHATTEPTGAPGTDETSTTSAGGDQPSATSAAAGPSSIPAGLQKYYTQKLQWGSCQDYVTSPEDEILVQDPAVRCAELTVPLDYSKPD